MSATAKNIIKFINSKNRYELYDLGVDEKIEIIMEVKRVLTKKNLVFQLEEKCHGLEITVNTGFTIIEPLTPKGLPSLFVINDKLITYEDYVRKLKEIGRDNSKFSSIKGSMKDREFLGAMGNDFFIQHEVNHIFVVRPTFSKYTEVDEIYQKVIKLTILDEDRWDKLCELHD